MSALNKDKKYMLRALALARRGAGYVCPNPMVGAVLVVNDSIVGKGWHSRAGEHHAEIVALESAGAKALGSTLYVTLEPCNHFGKTPPCTQALIKAGVKRVVCAMKDPNPNVMGGGMETLRAAGVEVTHGVCEEMACEINAGWRTWVTTVLPLVVLKLAVSLDGCIAFPEGAPEPLVLRGLSGRPARAQVQRLRRYVDAVMVGASTVVVDNCRLTNRSGFGTQPLRIVIDPQLRTPLDAAVYSIVVGAPPTMVVCSETVDGKTRSKFVDKGIEVQEIKEEKGRLVLWQLLSLLGQRGIQSVLCEGGSKLAGALIAQDCCDRLVMYHTPRLVGSNGVSCIDVEWSGLDKSEVPLELYHSRKVGPDTLSVYAKRAV